MNFIYSILSGYAAALNSLFPFTVESADGAIELFFGKHVRTKVRDGDLKARLKRLDAIQASMKEAADDIGLLRDEVAIKLSEMQDLKVTIDKMEKDKDGYEAMLEINRETFTGLMSDVQRKTETRSILIGLAIGLLTGTSSSYLIWFFTKV